MVDSADVVDALVSEIVAFPPSEHLALSGITYSLGFIVSSFIFLLHSVPELSESSEVSSAESSDELLSQFLHRGQASRCVLHYRWIG